MAGSDTSHMVVLHWATPLTLTHRKYRNICSLLCALTQDTKSKLSEFIACHFVRDPHNKILVTICVRLCDNNLRLSDAVR